MTFAPLFVTTTKLCYEIFFFLICQDLELDSLPIFISS